MTQWYCITLFFLLFLTKAQHLTSQWYNMDNGLPQNTVVDIVKDKYGFIWLATNGGIVRYDGNLFLSYNESKTSSMFNDFMSQGENDFFSVNDSKKEYIIISKRTLKNFFLKNSSLAYNKSVNNEIYRIFHKNSFLTHIFTDADYYYIKNNSETYFFSEKSIEYQKNNRGKRIIIKNNFNYKKLRNCFVQNGIIYIADPLNRRTMIIDHGKISYDNMPSLYNDPKTSLYWHQATGQVFVINDGNIYLSKTENGQPKLNFLLELKNVEKQLISSMLYDEDSHKMYFGDLVKGLNVITLSKFYVSKKNTTSIDQVCYAALPFSKNSVITKEGFEHFKNKSRSIFPNKLPHDKRYVLFDDSGNLVYAEAGKINRRFKTSYYKKIDSISFSPKGTGLYGLFKTGGLYLGKLKNKRNDLQLCVFANHSLTKISHLFKFSDDINTVMQYKKDLLYVGCNDGLYVVALSGTKVKKKIISNISIKQIVKTKDGNIWLTTVNQGIYLFKNNIPIKMPSDREGYISTAHTLLEDHRGFFWISSNNGLFKVSKKELLDYAENKNNDVIYYRFTKEQGLLNNEFNGNSSPSANILEDGEFVFPSMEGMVFFKPDDIKSYYPKPDQIFMERAKVNNRMIDFKNKLQLKSNFKMAEIYIDIPYFSSIENLHLQAKLDANEHDKWEDIKDSRIYTLANLRHGNYNLMIRYVGSENGKFIYKTIPIEILPFFYQTIIFKLIVVVLGFGTVVFIIQTRTNFLKFRNKDLKKNLANKHNELEMTREKLKNESEYQQKIMESISHDITTPVRFITMLSQQLYESENIDDQKKYFETIYKTSEQLYKFTLGLKEYTELYKTENIFEEKEYTLCDLVEAKRMLFQEIADEKQTEIYNYCDSNLKIIVNKNIFSAILHNLIDNAVKNTFTGEIIIANESTNEGVNIRISDTGIGMTKDQIKYYNQIFEDMGNENLIFENKGLGLPMVIQLVKKVKSKISFQQNIPKGMVVMIIISNKN